MCVLSTIRQTASDQLFSQGIAATLFGVCGQVFKFLMWNVLMTLCTKNYKNGIIFRRVIQNITGDIFETQCRNTNRHFVRQIDVFHSISIFDMSFKFFSDVHSRADNVYTTDGVLSDCFDKMVRWNAVSFAEKCWLELTFARWSRWTRWSRWARWARRTYLVTTFVSVLFKHTKTSSLLWLDCIQNRWLVQSMTSIYIYDSQTRCLKRSFVALQQ